MKTKSHDLFTGKLFARFFLPSLVSFLALAIGGIADSLYVGHALGEEGLFIIGAGQPVYMIFSMLSIGMAEGGIVHFSTALGKGHEREGREIFLSVITFVFTGLLLLVGLGLLLRRPLVQLLSGGQSEAMLRYVTAMLLTVPICFMQAPLLYFVQADGSPKLAAAALTLGNIVDCGAGFYLIVLRGAGVIGSVVSTTLGALMMEAVCLSHLLRGHGALRPAGYGLPRFRLALKSFVTGFSSAADYIYSFAVVLIFNRLLLSMAGEAGVAIYDVVLNTESVVAAVTTAAVMTILPLVSTFRGEGDRRGERTTMRMAIGTCLGITALFAGALTLLAGPYSSRFGISPAFLTQGAYAIRVYMLSMVFACMSKMLCAYCQSTERERLAYIATALRSFALLLATGLLFARRGYAAFWLCFPATEALTLALVAFTLFKKPSAQPEEPLFAETIEGEHTVISETCERMQERLEESGADMRTAYFVALAADEVCRIIRDHGGELILKLTVIRDEGGYTLLIRDNALAFNPMDISQDSEEGLGLKIVMGHVKEFNYRSFAGFNTLTFTFQEAAR